MPPPRQAATPGAAAWEALAQRPRALPPRCSRSKRARAALSCRFRPFRRVTSTDVIARALAARSTAVEWAKARARSFRVGKISGARRAHAIRLRRAILPTLLDVPQDEGNVVSYSITLSERAITDVGT